jgi:hypothetical protein
VSAGRRQARAVAQRRAAAERHKCRVIRKEAEAHERAAGCTCAMSVEIPFGADAAIRAGGVTIKHEDGCPLVAGKGAA